MLHLLAVLGEAGSVIYCVTLLAVYLLQRHLVFQPMAGDIYATDLAPYEILPYRTADGIDLRGLWFQGAPGKPVLVYFHGNAGNITHRLYKAQYFLARGYGVAFVAYHGYNGAGGQPTEANLYDDGRAALKALKAKGVTEEKIVLYGESLGTGVATQMASEMPQVKALVLEAPYTTIPEVAAFHYWYFPARALVRDKFDSAAKIGALKMPILIVHGTNDLTVPFRFGRELFARVTAPVKKFVALDGAGHQDIYNFSADGVVDDFIQNLH